MQYSTQLVWKKDLKILASFKCERERVDTIRGLSCIETNEALCNSCWASVWAKGQLKKNRK